MTFVAVIGLAEGKTKRGDEEVRREENGRYYQFPCF